MNVRFPIAARAPELEYHELVHVPLQLAGGMWGAAIYLAVLAFPESKLKRHAFLEDVKAFTVKAALRMGWKGEARAQYRKRSLRALEKSGPLITATQRLERERLPAGSLAIDLLVREFTLDSVLRIQPMRAGRKVTGLRSGTAGLAAQAKARKWLRGQGENDPEGFFADNFRNRGWRSTHPVLHLAMALQNALDGLSGDLGIIDLVWRPAWVPEALRGAEMLRAVLATRSRPLFTPLPDSICLRAA